MNVVLVDAYDSFVYIIEQYLRTLELQTTTLRCNDPLLRRRLSDPETDCVILGPGPGRPEEAGYPDLMRAVNPRTPILGICLGHQAIGLRFGGRVVCARNIMHGKPCLIDNDGKGVFAHTGGRNITACRYHSLIVDALDLLSELVVTATSEDGYIMGLRHRVLPIEGIQFHPESIATEDGLELFRGFVVSYLDKKINQLAVN